MRTGFVTLCALLVGCGAEPTAPGEEPPPGAPDPKVDSVAVLAGDNQKDSVYGQLDSLVVVRAMDSTGAPIVGQVISWVITSGGGSVFAAVGQTDSLGRAAQIWTLGGAGGVQTLEARAVHPTSGATIFAAVKATATPGLPKPQLIALRHADTTMYLGDTLDMRAQIVSVRDAYDNFITEYEVRSDLWDGSAVGDPSPRYGEKVVLDSLGTRHTYIWVNGVRASSAGRQVWVQP